LTRTFYVPSLTRFIYFRKGFMALWVSIKLLPDVLVNAVLCQHIFTGDRIA
jgi:hypothetical protein